MSDQSEIIIEIQNLVNKYGHLIHIKDIDSVLTLFCQGAELDVDASDVNPSTKLKGRENLRSLYDNGLAAETLWPVMSNHVTEVLSDTVAHGKVFIEVRTKSRGYQVAWIGSYEDIYHFEEGKWKFFSRKATVIRV